MRRGDGGLKNAPLLGIGLLSGYSPWLKFLSLICHAMQLWLESAGPRCYFPLARIWNNHFHRPGSCATIDAVCLHDLLASSVQHAARCEAHAILFISKISFALLFPLLNDAVLVTSVFMMTDAHVCCALSVLLQPMLHSVSLCACSSTLLRISDPSLTCRPFSLLEQASASWVRA